MRYCGPWGRYSADIGSNCPMIVWWMQFGLRIRILIMWGWVGLLIEELLNRQELAPRVIAHAEDSFNRENLSSWSQMVGFPHSRDFSITNVVEHGDNVECGVGIYFRYCIPLVMRLAMSVFIVIS